MMKWFKITGIAALAVAALSIGMLTRASPASANGGPHGNYTLTTSSCAGCHRAHTAIGPDLLKVESVYALCTTCHSGAATTDVVHGKVTTGSGLTPLNGGGFEQAMANSSGVFGPVTSSHTVADLPVIPPGGGAAVPASGDGTAWGSQNGDGTPAGDVGKGVQVELECTSCHNPHGSTNYRILKDATSSKMVTNPAGDNVDLLNWVSYQVLATANDVVSGVVVGYGFTTDDTNCPAIATGATTPTATPGPGTKCMARYTSGIFSSGTAVPDVTKGMNAFCATCHKSYLTKAGAPGYNSLNTPIATLAAGQTPTNPYVYPGTQDGGALDGHGNVARYRHSVDRTKSSPPKQPLRFAALGNDPNPAGGLTFNAMGCLTCHFAHGSSSAATPAPGDSVPEGPAGDSALLFYDNRGVCISCHQTVGTVVPPTSTPTSTPAPPTATATATPIP